MPHNLKPVNIGVTPAGIEHVAYPGTRSPEEFKKYVAGMRKAYHNLVADQQGAETDSIGRKGPHLKNRRSNIQANQRFTGKVVEMLESFVQDYIEAKRKGDTHADAVASARKASTKFDTNTLSDAPGDRPRSIRKALKGIPKHQEEDPFAQGQLKPHRRQDRLSDLEAAGSQSLGKLVRNTVKRGHKQAGRDTARAMARARDIAQTGTDDKLWANAIRRKKAEKARKEIQNLIANTPDKERIRKLGPLNTQSKPPKGVGPGGMYASTQIIGNKLVEAIKKVCWGKR
jgi:hypothetical protein